jgi:hypothetical protein
MVLDRFPKLRGILPHDAQSSDDQKRAAFLSHKVVRVRPLEGLKLSVDFDSGVTKTYDVKPLMEKLDVFGALRDRKFFESATVDSNGCGVIWNNNLDLSSGELWENGKPQA